MSTSPIDPNRTTPGTSKGRLDRPVAIITGASSGIGLATTMMLAGAGFAVVMAARGQEALAAAADRVLAKSDSAVLSHPCDVANPVEISGLVASTLQWGGRIDVLVNNAGYAPLRPIGQNTGEMIEQAFRVNAIGPALAIRAVWPAFEAQRSGCIVNVSSMATDDPFPGFFAYAAAKASVNLMARSCAKEGKGINVRAFSVAPGAVETPMLRAAFSTASLPSSACLTPESVAQVIVDCIEGRRDEDNGKTIFIPSPRP